MEEARFGFRTASNTNEQVVCSKACYVYGLAPELTTTGTITLRNGAAGGSDVRHVAAIGLTQAGKSLYGALFETGLTVQLSVGTDLTFITFRPR